MGELGTTVLKANGKVYGAGMSKSEKRSLRKLESERVIYCMVFDMLSGYVIPLFLYTNNVNLSCLSRIASGSYQRCLAASVECVNHTCSKKKNQY